MPKAERACRDHRHPAILRSPYSQLSCVGCEFRDVDFTVTVTPSPLEVYTNSVCCPNVVSKDVVEIMQCLAKEQGCTILLVTHDRRILDIADRIVRMEDGHLANNPNSAVLGE